MTKITFYQDDLGNFTGFTCKDHAGYAEEGSDIVCAAISVLVINTINSIEQFTETQMQVTMTEDAYIKVVFKSVPDTGAQLLLKSLILGIQSIEDDEETTEFVDLIFEEV